MEEFNVGWSMRDRSRAQDSANKMEWIGMRGVLKCEVALTKGR